nr:MFS transporter [Pyrinomonadaceae bacterium]
MPHSLSRKIVLHVIFFLSGITTVLIGQVLPVLAKHFTLSDLQVSYFFPAQFAGSLLGTLLTSIAGKRNMYFAATIAGSLLMAGGIILMNVDIFTVCLLGFAINGMGIGLTLPAINMLILEMNPDRAGSALSVLNFCWGL